MKDWHQSKAILIHSFQILCAGDGRGCLRTHGHEVWRSEGTQYLQLLSLLLSLSVCVCLYGTCACIFFVCICLYGTCACVCMCMWQCTCMCRPEDNLRFLSSGAIYLVLQRQGLSFNLEGKIRVGWLASEQQGSSGQELYMCTTTLGFSCGC